MRAFRCIVAYVLVLTASVCLSQSSRSDKPPCDIAVVVSAANPLEGISLSEVRKILTGERRFWSGNVQVKLVLREPGSPERDKVLNCLLKLNNKEFAQLWRTKIFRGEAFDEPLSVTSVASQEQYLAGTPGGLTFLNANSVPPQLKVLRLEGKLPGEPGYALK